MEQGENHHQRQRLLTQTVPTFFDRDDFNAAVDAQFAGGTPTQFFEDFSSFDSMGDVIFFGNEVAVPAVSSGLPELFSLEQIGGGFNGFIGTSPGPEPGSFFFFDESFFPSAFFGLPLGAAVVIRFPEPITGFFADFSGANDIGNEIAYQITIMMLGSGTTLTEQLIFPEDIGNRGRSFGLLIPDDFFGVDEIIINATAVGRGGDGFAMDNVLAVMAPSVETETPFCCTQNFDFCFVDNVYCNFNVTNCVDDCKGNWFPVDETADCTARFAPCTSSAECCDGLTCVFMAESNYDGCGLSSDGTTI